MNVRYLSFLLIIGLSSCDFGVMDKVNEAKKSIKEVKQSVKTVKKTAENLSDLSKTAVDFEKTAKILKDTKPLTKEKMKAWMPTELDGMKRDTFSLTAKLGVADIASLNMTFADDKKNKVEVKIVDGAGGGTALISPFLMVQKMQMDVENEKGYQRTEKLDGNNVLIEYKNPPKEKTSMKYVLNDRFLVEIDGKMNPKDLWALHNKLNIAKLAD